MGHADGLGHLEQVAAQRLDVVGGPHALEGRVEAADVARVLGGDPDRAVVGVALLGLDAADRQHRLAADVDHVDAEREGDDGVLRDAELAAAHEDHVVGETGCGEALVDVGEADAEGVGHRVGEDHRRRARAALAAVDVDEVDAALAVRHPLDQVVPEVQVADRGLDADRQPGLVGDQLDEVEHRVDVREGRVPAR